MPFYWLLFVLFFQFFVLFFSAKITIPNGKWIIGNVDYMGFYRTNYHETLWAKLIDQLKHNHSVSFFEDEYNLVQPDAENSYDWLFG